MAYGWKLALVNISMVPILLVTGYFAMHLQNHLQDDLHEAYEKSAQITCEQIAAIRTIASLCREVPLHAEFMSSLHASICKAWLLTAKNTFVWPF